METPTTSSSPESLGPLAAELKLRNAISDLRRWFVVDQSAVKTGSSVDIIRATAASVMLDVCAEHGGLDEMCAEFARVRSLMGVASEWDVTTRALIEIADMAYNAALMHQEARDAEPCVLVRVKSGLVMVWYYNALAEDGGIGSFRWMSKLHAVPHTRAECERVAAAWKVLSGEGADTVAILKFEGKQ